MGSHMAKRGIFAVGAYSRGGGLLTIFSSSVGAYSRGLFRGGGQFRDLQ